MGGAEQLLILASLAVLAGGPMLVVAELARRVSHRAPRYRLATLGAFHAGALLAGWVIWRMLKPPDWALSFWTTVQASVDSETFGHDVEHAAEVLAANVVILAAAGGLLASGLTWMSRRARLSYRP